MRDVHLAAGFGLSTKAVLGTEGTGAFEDIGSDGLDELEHLIGKVSDFPLSLMATAKLEEKKKGASVHGHDERCGDGLREQVPCIFELAPCVDSVIVTRDITLDAEANESAR